MASAAAHVTFNNRWSVRTPHLISGNSEFQSWAAETLPGMLSSEALREFESIMSVQDYGAGSILFLEQDSVSQVFVVLKGDVSLSLQDVGGRRLTLQIAKCGSVLGMHSALFGNLSEWSAYVLYPSKIAVIRSCDFLRFAKRNPEVYRLATVELITTLRHTCAALRIVGLSSCIRKRLASQLLAWGERGNITGDRTQFCMSLTHAQVAECIGVARESVTRALIDFKQRGLVEIRGSILRIPSTTALRNYAEHG